MRRGGGVKQQSKDKQMFSGLIGFKGRQDLELSSRFSLDIK
jgi:hypothetical protein